MRINALTASLLHQHHRCVISFQLQIQSVYIPGTADTVVIAFLCLLTTRPGSAQTIYDVTCFHWRAPGVPRCACYFADVSHKQSWPQQLFKRCDCVMGAMASQEGRLITYKHLDLDRWCPFCCRGHQRGRFQTCTALCQSDPSLHHLMTLTLINTYEYAPFDFATCSRGTGGAHIKRLRGRGRGRGSVLILCSQKGSPLLHLITADSRCWCWWCSVPFHPCPSTPLKVDSWGGSLTADIPGSRKCAS